MMRAQSENAGDTVSEVVKSPEEKKVPKLCLKRGLKSRHYKEFLKKTLARITPRRTVQPIFEPLPVLPHR